MIDRVEEEFRTLLGELAFRFRTDGQYDPSSRICINTMCGNDVRHPHVLISTDKQSPTAAEPVRDRMLQKYIDGLHREQVQAWYDELDKTADQHGPQTRGFYLSLYRRLHG